MNYEEFLESKRIVVAPSGFDAVNINPQLFDFQMAIVEWACKRGRAAIFADCGLGKTPMQLEWARLVCEHTGGDVLILAPLAVSQQTCREGVKFNVPVNICREQSDVKPGVNITNYEMLHKFDAAHFAGVVLDESSILKNFTGKYRTQTTESFRDTKYKLACTATPAPNDYMELGNHSEFLNVMRREEMLAMYFFNDGSETSKWHLKGHAETRYWEWVAEWAVYMQKPSDLGFDDGAFMLPEIRVHEIKVESEVTLEGQLFPTVAQTLNERLSARRVSIPMRSEAASKIAIKHDGAVVVWCNLNNESKLVSGLIPNAVEVCGADTNEHKEDSMLGFSAGDIRVLVTKPKMGGFGMNWQHCNCVVFLGLSDSWEQYYQAVRRCWRFGQVNPVDVYIVISEAEGEVLKNIKRKEADAQKMADNMRDMMSHFCKDNIKHQSKRKDLYVMETYFDDNCELHLGDCIDVSKTIQENSIGLSVFSPPFASLYSYSDNERDMGNCKNDDAFMGHFRFLVDELFRITMPGRHVVFHCMNLPVCKSKAGHIGIRDFRGELIRVFEERGFYYHSEVCIWKDPVTAMQRTKALGLLYKQLKKDSSMSRQGIPDYLVVMRKPGDNPQPIRQNPANFHVSRWQEWASPIWMDIRQSNTLQKMRADKDEKHICPLQLDVIERAIALWSNPGDVVFSPFAGIGSEGYQAIKMGRKFIGIELKKEYFNQAVSNLKSAAPSLNSELSFESRVAPC